MKKRITVIITSIIIGMSIGNGVNYNVAKAETRNEYLNNLNKYERLCMDHLIIGDLWDIDDNTDIADKVSQDSFDQTIDSYKGDGNCNAFRHSYWNALNYGSCGFQVATVVGNAHENIPSNSEVAYDNKHKLVTFSDEVITFDSYEMAAHYMDAYNNKVGRQVGREAMDYLINEFNQDGTSQYIYKAKAKHSYPDLEKEGNIYEVYTDYKLTSSGRALYEDTCSLTLRLYTRWGYLRRLRAVDGKWQVIPTDRSSLK